MFTFVIIMHTGKTWDKASGSAGKGCCYIFCHL